MGALSGFKLNSIGVIALLNSAATRALVTEEAERVLDAAIADPHDDTGAYESSLHIEHATTDRVVVRVVADDSKALILEANYGILARALDGGGGLVKYTSKAGRTSYITQAQYDNYTRGY